jgi:DNA replication protein DnaC
VLAGLVAAHDAGILHRDVKLDNIFLCDPKDGAGSRVVKLLDFGIAKLIKSRSARRPAPLEHSTGEGIALGTSHFFAPEQASFGALDERTDIYAMGVVLYTLVAGRGPFEHLTEVDDILEAHVWTPPARPSSLSRQSLPPEIEDVILKALAKRPEDRFRNACAFADTLTQAMRPRPRWVNTEPLRAALDRAAGSALCIEECVGLMVDREWTERENRRTGRRIKDAKLGMQACVEDLWCDPARGLDKAVVRSLGTCGWVRAKQNVIVIGMTGTGKSYVGAALAEAACRRGYRALRLRVPRLLDELAIARADGSYGATLSRLAKLDVLVLDDLLIAPLKDTERRDLLEVLEDRYDQRSTVVTSQVPTKTWHEMLADPTLADAICDRLVH